MRNKIQGRVCERVYAFRRSHNLERRCQGFEGWRLLSFVPNICYLDFRALFPVSWGLGAALATAVRGAKESTKQDNKRLCDTWAFPKQCLHYSFFKIFGRWLSIVLVELTVVHSLSSAWANGDSSESSGVTFILHLCFMIFVTVSISVAHRESPFSYSVSFSSTVIACLAISPVPS